jgi:hypothetical protein
MYLRPKYPTTRAMPKIINGEAVKLKGLAAAVAAAASLDAPVPWI